MGRYFIGTILPGQTLRGSLSLATPFNPLGDWGQAYVLAHPQVPDAELVCDFHGKVQRSSSGNRYFYTLSVTNRGPLPTPFDVDF